MPTYSYACTDCHNKFDVVQAFTDDSLTECPQCHGRLRKVFGKVGVVFKGSGFYRTDSRESGKSSGGGSSSNGASSSSEKSTSEKSSSSDKSSSDKSSASGSSSSSGSSAPAAAASS
ncbi:FmdB family zinc ribbon protein [Mycobacterium sp. ITM-2016-00317]|uniref:FmdB family zinc ribbon protein n=1 Tax=Mycobacterium sp. ITM-2016-00317 TaxID=2099694 RepID=UPI000D4F3D2F|nr:FmdB family zinc ribbon protein [Mycobacterium sp. ITM-2016-00317]WNG86556.1 FmdB family zinc ribbon protein [Mycobacterium sp. ITM-2016-00317]